MPDADEKVGQLILHLLHGGDRGWESDCVPPEHFADCPDVVVIEAEANHELWFDTGVDAVRLTARLRCPHRGEGDWEWADLGELPYLIEDMGALPPAETAGQLSVDQGVCQNSAQERCAHG